MARYLAVLIHRLLAHGQAWIDQGLRSLNEKRLNRELANLQSLRTTRPLTTQKDKQFLESR